MHVDIDDTPQVRVIRKETVYGFIAICYESFGKASEVETLQPVFATVTTAEKLDAGDGVVDVQ